MQLIIWNIQWSRGIDGRVDPARIVAAVREMGDFDVLCLQEVTVNFSTLAGFGSPVATAGTCLIVTGNFHADPA